MSTFESWTKEFPIGAYIAGQVALPVPKLLTRTDGCGLLYTGLGNEIHGEPEAGKGWLVAQAVSEAVHLGRPALYLDFDTDPAAAAIRLQATGVTPEQADRRIRYRPISDPLPIGKEDGVRIWERVAQDVLEELLGNEGPGLVVMDGVNAGMALFGLKPGDLGDVADFLRLLVHPFRGPETVILLVDHVVKNGEARGRWSYRRRLGHAWHLRERSPVRPAVLRGKARHATTKEPVICAGWILQ